MSRVKKNGRFMVGLVGVALVVSYLMWTGVQEAMVYSYTPAELLSKVGEDPTLRDVGVRVDGMMVPGTYARVAERTHEFTIRDAEQAGATLRVRFSGTVPDTFRPEAEDMQVVATGRLGEDGIFVASDLMAKCGSRYEAYPGEAAG